MMNMAQILFGTVCSWVHTPSVPLFEQLCCYGVTLPANPTVSAGNGTWADDDNRMRIDSLKKGKGKRKCKHQNQKGNHTNNTSNMSSTDINTCKNCGRTEHWAKDCWRPGGETYDNPTTDNNHTQIGKNRKKGKRQKQTSGRCGNESAF